ncbi:MAG: SpoIIE family protein phosphatase, partial [Leptospiraceae bacterium]|nr:SpoIIE family protein phosphatase [Leptospiraceae bacterium]
SVWFESNEFAFLTYLDSTGKIVIEYDSIVYSSDFEIAIEDYVFKVSINDLNKSVQVNNKTLFTFTEKKPIQMMCNGNTFEKDHTGCKGFIIYNLKELRYQVFLNLKNFPLSVPGQKVVSNQEFMKLYKGAIHSKTDYIETKFRKSNYGTFMSAIAIIRDSNSQPIGFVEVDVSQKELRAFQNLIYIVSLKAGILILIVMGIGAHFLAKMITTPIQELKRGIKSISEGNLLYRVKFKGKDEFSTLARNFNWMSRRLNVSQRETLRLNEELQQFNSQLEKRIKERTEDLEIEKMIVDKAMNELQKRNAIIEQDLDRARKIQKSLLPQKTPTLENYKIYSFYQPMDKVGGDLYGFLEFHNGDLGIFIADVSGHGIASAFIASIVKQEFDSIAPLISSPAEILTYLNQNICKKFFGNFLTMFYLILKKDGKIICANGGHAYPFIYSPLKNKLIEVEVKGKLLGAFPETVWHDHEFSLENKDRLILLTDGVIETGKKELFGEERLKKLIIENHHLSGNLFIKKIMHSVNEFNEFLSLKDDITIVLLERNG